RHFFGIAGKRSSLYKPLTIQVSSRTYLLASTPSTLIGPSRPAAGRIRTAPSPPRTLIATAINVRCIGGQMHRTFMAVAISVRGGLGAVRIRPAAGREGPMSVEGVLARRYVREETWIVRGLYKLLRFPAMPKKWR